MNIAKYEVKDIIKYLCALLGINADDNKLIIADIVAEIAKLNDKVGFVGFCKKEYMTYQFQNGFQKFLSLLSEWQTIERTARFLDEYKDEISDLKSRAFALAQKITAARELTTHEWQKSFSDDEKRLVDNCITDYNLSTVWNYEPAKFYSSILRHNMDAMRKAWEAKQPISADMFLPPEIEFEAIKQNQIQVEVKRFGDDNQKSSTGA